MGNIFSVFTDGEGTQAIAGFILIFFGLFVIGAIARSGAYHTFEQSFGQVCCLCFLVYFAIRFMQVPWVELVTLLVIFYRVGPQVTAFNQSRQYLAGSVAGYERICKLQGELATQRRAMPSGNIPIERFEKSIRLEEKARSTSQNASLTARLIRQVNPRRVRSVFGRRVKQTDNRGAERQRKRK